MPVSFQNNSSSDNIYDNYNNIVYGEIDESRIDCSPLSNVDPDINFTMRNKQLDCKYYTESEFNHTFHALNMFSMYHVNMRSIPRNLIKLQYHLEELSHNFTIIAISECYQISTKPYSTLNVTTMNMY